MYIDQEMENSWTVSSSLTVNNITADDGGYHTCIAENETGFTEGSVLLYARLYSQVGRNTNCTSIKIIS